jgi:ABC-type transporter Mla maintaining outer membrane lipid asymmetry permease subunit MlaE
MFFPQLFINIDFVADFQMTEINVLSDSFRKIMPEKAFCQFPFLKCGFEGCVMGILGGAIVGVGILDITPAAYFHQTCDAVALNHFGVGLIKSVFFGIIVAVSGCMRGMQCGRSASAVGIAATSAVVTGIVAIIVSDALMTVIFSIIDM